MLKKIAISTLLIGLAVPALEARPPEGPGGPPRPERAEKMLKRMKKDLDLTEEQVTKIKAIQQKYHVKQEAIREKMEPLHKELMKTMMSDSPNRATFESLLRKLSDLRIQGRLIEFDQRQEIMAVLTAEQRAEWIERMEKHRKKFMKKRRKDDRD